MTGRRVPLYGVVAVSLLSWSTTACSGQNFGGQSGGEIKDTSIATPGTTTDKIDKSATDNNPGVNDEEPDLIPQGLCVVPMAASLASPPGFGANDVLALVVGRHEAILAPQASPSVAPTTLPPTAAISWTVTGDLSNPYSAGVPGETGRGPCGELLVPASVTVKSADGSLDETWFGLVSSSEAGTATVVNRIPASELTGSLQLQTADAKNFFDALELRAEFQRDGSFSGDLIAEVRTKVADEIVTERVVVASF